MSKQHHCRVLYMLKALSLARLEDQVLLRVYQIFVELENCIIPSRRGRRRSQLIQFKFCFSVPF